MTDELDSLTDSQLSEAFAVEVAELRIDPELPIVVTQAAGLNQIPVAWEPIPKFATSADAVLPFLKAWTASDSDKPGMVTVYVTPPRSLSVVYAMAPTFARAACISLIRAKRASK